MTPYELYTSLVAKIRVSNYNLLSIGKTLKDLKQEDKFKQAIGGTDTWQHFVKQPDVWLTVGEANKLIEVYETFIEQLGYSEEQISTISFKNLKTILPYANGVQNYSSNVSVDIFDTVMEKASTLSTQDLKDALIETSESLEEVPRTYKYVVMKICNETKNMSKVHEVTEEVKEQLKL